MQRKLLAELIGTFWLVFGGCGSALLAAGIPDLGIGFAGIALAFGLTVLTGIYAVGSISGGHFNPAVSLGLMLAGRFDSSLLIPYWVVQIIGSVLAATLLYVIVSGAPEFVGPGSFASNGYGAASPGGYSFLACAVTEITMTAVFIFVILGATSRGAPVGFAGIAIGLCLTLIHLVSIPVTNTSVNPARSTGVALFADGPALAQLWFFWVMPLVGAALGALIWKLVAEPTEAAPPERTTAQV